MSGRVVRGLEIGMFPVLWIVRTLFSIPPRWWKRLLLAIVLASLGVMVWSRFHGTHGTLGDGWVGLDNLALIARSVCIGALYGLGLYGLDSLAVTAARRIARLLPVAGNGALAVSRHTLESRHPINRRAFWTSNAEVGALALMAAAMCWYTAGFTIDRAQSDQANALTFDAVVAPAGTSATSSSSIGVDTAAMDPGAVSALEADPKLAVVPFGSVTVGPVDGGTVHATVPAASITVVSPSDLDRVTPDGARPLGLQDGVLLSPDLEESANKFPATEGLVDVSADDVTATLFHRTWFNATTLATRSWAESTWGNVPVVGALVTYKGDDLSAAGRLGYIHDAALRVGADAHAAPSFSAAEVSSHRSDEAFYLGLVWVMSGMVLIAAGFGAVLLSLRTVRAHRQVRATVAALGAAPRSLALAVPIDAGVTLAVAFAIGLPLGTSFAALGKHPTLLASGAPFDPATTAWGLWWNLSHVSWGLIAAVVAATWLLAVAATTVYGFLVARRTPVDELRVAIKEGAV